jgi:uncharacterized protein
MSTKYQDKFGHPIERTKGKVRPFMAGWIQDFIRHSPFCVVATSNNNGDCDASPKGGMPGFVKVLNDSQLFIPDVAGNKLFHGYGNIESNPKIGFDFLHSRAQFDGANQWKSKSDRSKRVNRRQAGGLRS